jgi:hypothetical protein
VSFAPLAFKLFYAARQNAVLRRSSFPSQDDDASPDDLAEAVNTLEEVERIARRVFGGAHPLTTDIGHDLRDARAALGARETPPPGSA